MITASVMKGLNEPIEMDELIKLVNQSNYQTKGALVIETVKTF